MASFSTSHGAALTPSPAPATAQSPASSTLLPCPNSPSSLSPAAHLFMPSGRSMGDSSPSSSYAELSPPPRPSYRDVLAPHPATTTRVLKFQSATATQVLAAVPRPALRSVLGFCSVSHCHRHPPLSRSHPRRAVPEDLRGRCFNCFSTRHRAAVCRHRTRCFRCLEPGHRSYVCPRKLAALKPLRWLAWRLLPAPTNPMAVAAPAGEGERRDPPWRRP
jgi:hypothetical protein